MSGTLLVHHLSVATSSNYKRALTILEAANKIKVEPPANERRKIKGEVTFADHVRVIFPRKN
jgi:hypothetical protein